MLARAAYKAAEIPAGPAPMITIFSTFSPAFYQIACRDFSVAAHCESAILLLQVTAILTLLYMKSKAWILQWLSLLDALHS